MHEINHQIGAPDHYHELDAYGNCKFADICSECGTNPRQGTCIMCTTEISINNSDVICSECQLEIISHLENHHIQ